MAIGVGATRGNAGWARVAWWCRKIGIVGVVGLIILVSYSLYQSHASAQTSGCFAQPVQNVALSDSSPPGVRIIGVDPVDIALNRILCLRVDNVVSQAKQNVLLANVTVASAAVKQSAVAGGAAARVAQSAPVPAQADATLADAVQTKAKADLDSAKAEFDDAQKQRVMVLYLNGKASPLTAPARAIAGPQTLTFEVKAPEDANSADAAYWRSILATPTSDGRIKLRIGVAEQGAPAPLSNVDQVTSGTAAQPITFLLYTPRIKYAALAAMVAIVLLFFGMAYDTTLLRMGRAIDSAYSLALVQMAIWFILTTTGFVYIWVVTGQFLNVFSSGLFVLIGISGATATAAFAIDRGQPAPTSNGFLYDITGAWRDGEVQLQRLQIIAWTVILALIFFWNVLGKLTLTSFDANLLVLTGIANGVYVSLKPQEARSAAPATTRKGTPR